MGELGISVCPECPNEKTLSKCHHADRNGHSSARFKSNSSPIHVMTWDWYLMCWSCNVEKGPTLHGHAVVMRTLRRMVKGTVSMWEWWKIMKINTKFINKNHNLRKPCNELSAYLKVEQMNFDIQFWKQCCSVMHDWRNFNNVSFESIMVILYDKSHTPRNLVATPCFFSFSFSLSLSLSLFIYNNNICTIIYNGNLTLHYININIYT